MDNITATAEDLKELFASLNREDMNLQVQVRTLNERMKTSASQLQETMKQYGEFMSPEVRTAYENLKTITKDFTATVLTEDEMCKLQGYLPEIQNMQRRLTAEAGDIQAKLKQLTEKQGG